MTPPQNSQPAESENFLDELSQEARFRIDNFADPHQEWRRLSSEFVGTFFLVLVAGGAAMVGKLYPGTVPQAAAVIAPGAMVMAIIMFMGKVSGAHLNPAVSCGFALRGDFPWRRVPGYIVTQLLGATVAAIFLQWLVTISAKNGGSYPGERTSDLAALATEAILTFGLVSVILGTASGAQSIGIIAAIGVGSYIALAGLWAASLSGASMNPARTFGPNFIGGDLSTYWIYAIGPLVGSLAAVGFAMILRGTGGGQDGSLAAQGDIDPDISDPQRS
ncbi:MAG: hypothetical protein CMH41_00195 [Micrococcales bacterium]|nr:hypothetical protein [Micrococcales bacterium]